MVMDASKGVEIGNSPDISAEYHYIRSTELRAGEAFLSVADNDPPSMRNHIHIHSLPFFLSFSPLCLKPPTRDVAFCGYDQD